MEKTQIAILITCHNRRETTLSCLDAINNQKLANTVTLQVYLVDAGSTDGTKEAVLEHFPEVNLIPRDKDLFWCGGMRVAFDMAARNTYDYYLWLNDDTKLLSDSIQKLLKTAKEIRERVITTEQVSQVFCRGVAKALPAGSTGRPLAPIKVAGTATLTVPISPGGT